MRHAGARVIGRINLVLPMAVCTGRRIRFALGHRLSVDAFTVFFSYLLVTARTGILDIPPVHPGSRIACLFHIVQTMTVATYRALGIAGCQRFPMDALFIGGYESR